MCKRLRLNKAGITIAFKMMILGRQQGGDRLFRSSPTDNTPKIFIWKAITKEVRTDEYGS